MTNIEMSEIEFEQRESVRGIFFNRPERLNAVYETVYLSLLAELKQALDDPGVHVVMLSGRGRAFCVGADLKAHKEGRTPEQKREYLAMEQQLCRMIYSADKPVVAAINGFAIGAGFEIAVNCPFILMSDTAEASLPEVDLGTFVGGGVTWLLPRLIGLTNARKLLLGELGLPVGSKRWSAQSLASLGLIHRIFSHHQFIESSWDFCLQLSRKPQQSLRQILNITRSSLDESYLETSDRELLAMIHCSSTDDWQQSLKGALS